MSTVELSPPTTTSHPGRAALFGPVRDWVPRIWATPLRRALVVTVTWRVILGIWGVMAHGLELKGPDPRDSLLHAGWPRNPFTLLIDSGVRLDATWYASIARQGYTFSTHHMSSIAFYPFFPMVIKAVSLVTGDVYVAGMMVSTAALFVAIWLLQLWMDRHGFGARGPAAAALLLSFPFAFFLVSMYTESLFLVLVLATFILVEDRRWECAALFGFLAALTRPTGIILSVAILALLWQRKDLGLRAWSAVAAPVAGLLSFAGYQLLVFGTPMASVRAMAVAPWLRTPRQALSDLMLIHPGLPPWFLLFLMAFGAVFLAAVPAVYRRFGPAYATYAGLAVLLPAFNGVTSLERYVLVDFPVFALVACAARRWVPIALATAGFWMLLGFTALFIGGFALT